MSKHHRPHNLLFISVMNGAAWGGSEELWFQSALWCAQNNYDVSICCFDWKGKKEKLKQLTDAGCTLYVLPGREQTSKNPLLARRRTRKKLNEVPFNSFDATVVNQGGWKDLASFPFSYLFTRIKNYVILYHNYNPFESISNTRSQVLQEWAIGAKKNLCATFRIFQTMENNYHIPVPNQLKLYNPLTIEVPSHPPSWPGLHNYHYKFSVLAALDIERKAQDILITSLSDEKWKKRNWELHFYGEGKDKDHLKRLVTKLEMNNRIYIHGNARDYTAAVISSHLILQITHLDAMPLSVIEAMAMAKPLVVSDVGDMPLWVKENKNGWISKKVNREQILETMERAWENRSDWEKMGLISYEIFKKEFPADPVAHFLRQCDIL